GGVVGDTALSPDVVAGATVIVLVARIEADTVAQVVTLRSATAAGAAPVMAVFTHRRGLSAKLRKRRQAGGPQ
ncbi:MAG: hypothetical protein U1D00_25330, partial [Mycobacterium sp.]|nr:hypothetical protein [Mycobacterium sp.]